MSGQRYVPANDARYPRDRSPPRYDRGVPDRNAEYSASSAFARDVAPRAPRALVDAPRASGPPPLQPPRERGYPVRADARRDFRDRDLLRDRPGPQSWGSRWVRDAPREPPRENDLPRPRRDSRDELPPYAADARSARGGFARGRGRGDWDSRGRGRDVFPDDRAVIRLRSPRSPRSRSPPRRWDRDVREGREYDRYDPRRPERRDEERPVERDDRDRDVDRYRRDSLHLTIDPKRPSAPSTAPSTPHVPSLPQTQSLSAGRAGADFEREPFVARHPSAPSVHSLQARDARRDSKPESIAARSESSKIINESRPSSPIRPPEVPAFGSIAFKPPPVAASDTPWNVWRAPDKPVAQPAPSLVPAATSKAASAGLKVETDKLPPAAPRADRIAEQIGEKRASIVQGVADTQQKDLVALARPKTPTGPAADALPRVYDAQKQTESVPIKSPPTGPRQLAHNHSSARPAPPIAPRASALATSPSISPAFPIPSGPRNPSLSGPASLGANVPTGPKAIRSQPPVPQARPPFVQTRQWSRGPAPTPSALGSTGVKRDLDGQPKPSPEKPVSDTSISSMAPYAKDEPTDLPLLKHKSHEESRNSAIQSSSVAADAGLVSGNSIKRASEPPTIDQASSGDEEDLALDEEDFQRQEANFEQEKARLEALKVDLSSRHLRGASPLRRLALLSRIALADFSMPEFKSVTSTNINVPVVSKEELLEPKAEEPEEATLSARPTPRPRTRRAKSVSPPITDAEIDALPFLNREPITPISELDITIENQAMHARLRDSIMVEMMRQDEEESERNEELKREYGRLYKPWRAHCDRLDKEAAEKAKREKAAQEEAIVDTSPTMASATGGRQRGITSDYQYQKILQASIDDAREEEAKRQREATTAKPDYDKEAVIPPMRSEEEQRRRLYINTSTLRKPEDAIRVFELEPPEDDFTPEEHQTMVQNFKEYPKKFGKLAEALPDRTYKDCIQHYYATKWNKEFKPSKDKRRKVGTRGGRRTAAIQGRPKANALISNLGGPRPEVYDGDEAGAPVIPVTDSGRPKRAAAPTFGDKDTDDQSGLAATPNKKNTRIEAPENGEKYGKRSKTGKEKAQKPRKPQQPAVQPREGSISPERKEPDMPGRTIHPRPIVDAGALEGANTLAHMQGSSQQPISQQPILQQPESAMQVETYQHGQMAGIPPSQQQKGGPSSYWSVQEVTSFPAFVEHFGTDWQSIAHHMGTKSHTMVKNYYNRQITTHKDVKLEEAARIANDRREKGEAMGPPPVLPAIPTKRREQPYQPVIARPLAPSAPDLIESGKGSPTMHDATIATDYPPSVHHQYPVPSQSQGPQTHTRTSSNAQSVVSAQSTSAASFAPVLTQHAPHTPEARALFSKESYSNSRPSTQANAGAIQHQSSYPRQPHQELTYGASEATPAVASREIWPERSRYESRHEYGKQEAERSGSAYHSSVEHSRRYDSAYPSRRHTPPPVSAKPVIDDGHLRLYRPDERQVYPVAAPVQEPYQTSQSTRHVMDPPPYKPSASAFDHLRESQTQAPPPAIKEDSRSSSWQSQTSTHRATAASPPLPAARAEPRRSTLMDILNNDSEEPKRPKVVAPPSYATRHDDQPSPYPTAQSLARQAPEPERQDPYRDSIRSAAPSYQQPYTAPSLDWPLPQHQAYASRESYNERSSHNTSYQPAAHSYTTRVPLSHEPPRSYAEMSRAPAHHSSHGSHSSNTASSAHNASAPVDWATRVHKAPAASTTPSSRTLARTHTPQGYERPAWEGHSHGHGQSHTHAHSHSRGNYDYDRQPQQQQQQQQPSQLQQQAGYDRPIHSADPYSYHSSIQNLTTSSHHGPSATPPLPRSRNSGFPPPSMPPSKGDGR